MLLKNLNDKKIEIDLSFNVIVFLVLVSFFFGAYTLEQLGIQYVTEGGIFVFKIHLYSYVVLIFFTRFMFIRGISGLIKSMSPVFNSWLMLVLSIVVVLIYSVARNGFSGAAYIVDTLLIPLLVLPLISSISYKNLLLILNLFLFLVILNSSLSIYEYLIKYNFIESYRANLDFSYFRSTGFLSHPLNNALIMAGLFFLLVKNDFINPFFLFLIVLLALFSFGSRASSVIFLILNFLFFLYNILILRNEKEITVKNYFLYLIVFIVSFFLLMYSVEYLGIADRLIDNFSFEDDSSETRFNAFYVFEYVSTSELMFGVSNVFFDDLFLLIKSNVLENYLLTWVLFYGLVISIPMIFIFKYFLYRLFVCGDYVVRFSLVLFLISSYANNSLSIKTQALFLFLVGVWVYIQKTKFEK